MNRDRPYGLESNSGCWRSNAPLQPLGQIFAKHGKSKILHLVLFNRYYHTLTNVDYQLLVAGDSHVLRMRRQTEVQCVYAFRTSSTHYTDPAVSVHKSQDCENIQKPACIKVLNRENGNDALMAALTSLILGCDTFWEHRPNAMSIR
jgi:hypothetical protein